MPGTPVVKSTPNERTLTFWENLYLPEIFKGLGYSASKMSLESYAFEYPEEQWYPPDSYRGRPVLVEEQGRPRCVSCGLCARSCPPLAISMQAHEVTDDIKEREPEWFEINMLRCIYCGFCEEVCPEEAIVMSKEYDLTFQHRDEAHFGLDKLLVPKERLVDRLEFLERRRNGQPAGDWQHKPENNVHTLRNRLDYLARLEDAEATVNAIDPQEPLAEDVDAV
ncbi:NADH-quinone oxidoreductase subunit I [Rubrivirga sp. S365]|uniref:NADH-quinone oxidoreductase subunit I n=1 Tax=Rubrivirga litoralis TaxID=3075598 RepID=A0ABU3BP88_9BACT|nr:MULTISPECIES: NADH-quinone oxidoreductase subunit I [unclassified Rubrivirga]MDT0631106.1 NADH-quinone oxidoreductase subunit I [Rubrivirga sp. F394]MDT7855381.1 NADH-quinone oxidoreductase subunit I [Rubrivirga sp. S365]